MLQIQVTLCSTQGYRAMSTVITVPSATEYLAKKDHYNAQAVTAMLAKRYMTTTDLRKYGYTTLKTRVYDKEKIERENAERYERIKKERGWA